MHTQTSVWLSEAYWQNYCRKSIPVQYNTVNVIQRKSFYFIITSRCHEQGRNVHNFVKTGKAVWWVSPINVWLRPSWLPALLALLASAGWLFCPHLHKQLRGLYLCEAHLPAGTGSLARSLSCSHSWMHLCIRGSVSSLQPTQFIHPAFSFQLTFPQKCLGLFIIMSSSRSSTVRSLSVCFGYLLKNVTGKH